MHLLAHINLRHGTKAMLMMMWIWQQSVYCRGQRHLNLLANHQWLLLVISYGWWKKMNDVTYEKKRILSNTARKITSLVLHNKHIQMEMVIMSGLFLCILLPLVTEMSGESVHSKQADISQSMVDIKKAVGGDGGPGIVLAVFFGFGWFSKILHNGLRLDLKLYTDRRHKKDSDPLTLSRTVYSIQFQYALQDEISNDMVVYIQVIHLIYRLIDELQLKWKGKFHDPPNDNHSINVHTHTKTIEIQIATNNTQTKQSLNYHNIHRILSTLTDGFHIFVLWHTFTLNTQNINEAEPLWAIPETYEIVKRLVLMTALSVYIHPNYNNVQQHVKTDLIVLKGGLLRGAQRYFQLYDDRHWVKIKDSAKGQQLEEEEEKQAEPDPDEEQTSQGGDEHIDYHNIGQQIDFYYHVNGVHHYILKNMRYSQVFWLCTLVKYLQPFNLFKHFYIFCVFGFLRQNMYITS